MKHFNVAYVITEVREVLIKNHKNLTEEEAKDLFWQLYYETNLADESECVQCSTEIKYISGCEDDVD